MSSTSPKAFLYLPSPKIEDGQSAALARRPTDSERVSAEWVRVPTPGQEPRVYVDADIRQTLRAPNGHHHLTIPVCEDPERLGDQGMAAIHRVQLDVFSKLAQDVLPRASGAKMRQYFDRMGRGEAVGLTEHTGLTIKELINFREYFSRLPEYWRGESLGRPELLAVAAQLLGGNSGSAQDLTVYATAGNELRAAASYWLGWNAPVQPMRADNLHRQGAKQVARLEAGMKATRAALIACRGGYGASEASRAQEAQLQTRMSEIDCYLSLVMAITAVAQEATVQTMLAPPPALPDQAASAASWLSAQAGAGAKRMGTSLLRSLQGHLSAPQGEKHLP